MGPPSSNGGRIRGDGVRATGTEASMGPPSFNGGRALFARAMQIIEALQWGLRLSTEEGPAESGG